MLIFDGCHMLRGRVWFKLQAFAPWFGLPTASSFAVDDGTQCTTCAAPHCNEMKLGSLFFAMQAFAGESLHSPLRCLVPFLQRETVLTSGGIFEDCDDAMPFQSLHSDDVQLVFAHYADEGMPLLIVRRVCRSMSMDDAC